MSSTSEERASGTGEAQPKITVSDLSMAYGDSVVMQDLNFTVNQGDIFIIMGGSGSGKSTLLRHLLGLQEPARGRSFYQGTSAGLWDIPPPERESLLRRFGVLYQSGALWSSMTLADNVALPLQEFAVAGAEQISALSSLKLALVGLAGFEDYYPSEISGGMTSALDWHGR
jgi:phospholipid/cholesterol/gamma-HCH transport system ATP-binding protein